MSLGFVEQALNATVEGIVNSISIAHDNMKPATLSLGTGMLYNASINRSPSAYLNNPEEERSRYGNFKLSLRTSLGISSRNQAPSGVL